MVSDIVTIKRKKMLVVTIPLVLVYRCKGRKESYKNCPAVSCRPTRKYNRIANIVSVTRVTGMSTRVRAMESKMRVTVMKSKMVEETTTRLFGVNLSGGRLLRVFTSSGRMRWACHGRRESRCREVLL